MARRRTRRDKTVAKLRKELELKSIEIKEKPVIKPSFYQPEAVMPVNLLTQDLTRTGVVTILALVLQVGIFMYLNNWGGWQIISQLWERR